MDKASGFSELRSFFVRIKKKYTPRAGSDEREAGAVKVKIK
jgi:hypothetical protein